MTAKDRENLEMKISDAAEAEVSELTKRIFEPLFSPEDPNHPEANEEEVRVCHIQAYIEEHQLELRANRERIRSITESMIRTEAAKRGISLAD
jgi:hypothetical protein